MSTDKSAKLSMYASLLPPRGGSNPVNHSVTSFNRVRIPPGSLLGSLEPSSNPRLDFLLSIWRVAIGAVAISAITLPALKIAATIGALYSQRRTVGNAVTGKAEPILVFRTQQIPILTAIAHAKVLDAFYHWTVSRFVNGDEDMRVRHGLATCYKTVSIQLSQAAAVAISERCGAQGLFHHNMLTTFHVRISMLLSVSYADVFCRPKCEALLLRREISSVYPSVRRSSLSYHGLLLTNGSCYIGLAIELLLERYGFEDTANPDSILARHENGLLKEARRLMGSANGHRSDDVDRSVLPLCQPLVEAIGHRMAYDAAVAANVEPAILDLFVASILKYDAAWYAEHGTPQSKQREMEDVAISAMLPHLPRHVEELGVVPYITAPLVSDAAWTSFLDKLPHFTGQSAFEALPRPTEPMLGARIGASEVMSLGSKMSAKL
jgi:acyl-CoA oxidase